MSLIERIEAASAADHAELDAIDRAIAEWCRAGGAPGLVNYDPDLWLERNGGWVRSIDAAVALADRVLPGWVWIVRSPDLLMEVDAKAYAEITAPDDNASDCADASTPALALVAAVLRAKEVEG